MPNQGGHIKSCNRRSNATVSRRRSRKGPPPPETFKSKYCRLSSVLSMTQIVFRFIFNYCQSHQTPSRLFLGLDHTARENPQRNSKSAYCAHHWIDLIRPHFSQDGHFNSMMVCNHSLIVLILVIVFKTLLMAILYGVVAQIGKQGLLLVYFAEFPIQGTWYLN